MNNDLKIKPLMKYEVIVPEFTTDTFTADTMVRDDEDVLFFRTGNLIRVYSNLGGMRIVVTPVDEIETE